MYIMHVKYLFILHTNSSAVSIEGDLSLLSVAGEGISVNKESVLKMVHLFQEDYKNFLADGTVSGDHEWRSCSC